MAQANSNEAEGRGPQKGLVLVVDDDSRTQRLEKFVLEEEGFPVETVGSGEEALAIFDTISPVLVLLDVNMPGIDGFTTCQRIREISQVPIIMVTGENRDEDKVRGLELGADDYVTKPFAIAELAARVKAVLRRYDGGVIPEISDLDRKIAALSPGFIAKVMVGDPDEDTLCAAPAVSVSKTVSPEIVYVDDADQTFLYTIQIVNDGSAAVFIKEIKDLLHDSFRYLPLPITSPEADDDCVDTAPSSVKSKNAKKDKPAFTEIKWKFPKDDPLALAAGESWCIQFEAEATRLEGLPAGYYANEAEVRFDKTRLLIEPPPPIFDNDEAVWAYTYEIVIRNETGEVIEEEDDDLVIDEIKATMNDGLTYVPGSVTSDPDPVNVVTGGPLSPGDPDDKDIKIGEVKWKFDGDFGDGVFLDGNETWVFTFQATSLDVLPPGEDDLVVKLKTSEKEDRPGDRVTGPTAVVMSVLAYRVTVVVGGTTFICDLWSVPEDADDEVEDFQVLDFCDF